jgi:hypothetical protein
MMVWENLPTEGVYVIRTYSKIATRGGMEIFNGSGVFGVPLAECKSLKTCYSSTNVEEDYRDLPL